MGSKRAKCQTDTDIVRDFLVTPYRNWYNLCTPFKHDIRCASLCGSEFVVTKERREKRAQRESCLKEVRSLLYLVQIDYDSMMLSANQIEG